MMLLKIPIIPRRSKKNFNPKIASLIDGLTKISGTYNKPTSSSMQAENFRKMLLTLSDDMRVILIKIADRLHNMRTSIQCRSIRNEDSR